MFDFLSRVFCCGGARTSNVETIKTTLLDKSNLSELETLKIAFQKLETKDQTLQNILIKMQDQLDGNVNVSLLSAQEATIRKLRSANAKLQETVFTSDTSTLDDIILTKDLCKAMVEKTNIFATSFKHTSPINNNPTIDKP